jgi:SAM-dependent methyltransferase
LSFAARLLLCAVLVARAGPTPAQDPGPVHDAPYVPTPRATVDEMLRLAAVGPGDLVYDLGSGDGRVVIAAAKHFGARGVGVELNPSLVARSRRNAVQAGVADRVRFLEQDLFQTELGEATVVTLYLSPNLNLRLRPALLRLRPGTRIVSHASDLGDWKPDRRTSIRKDVLLWIVPAGVSGRWRSAVGTASRARPLEIEFLQRYQEVTARAHLDGAAAPVWEARLEADRLSFVIVEAPGSNEEVGLYFEGRVRGSVIEGTVARGVGSARSVAPWRAERVAK